MLLRDLEYFLRIAETGSLRQAAVMCEVSQPAVSKGLKRLETELGLTLVQRSRHGAVLSEMGRSFLSHARRLHRDLAAAMQEAKELRAGALGLVRVGMTPALVESAFQDACAQILAQRPTARFRVRIGLSDDLLAALRRGEIDVMLSGIPEGEVPDLDLLPIGSNTLYVVARSGHPLFGKQHPQLADFAREQWILPRRGVLSRDWLDLVFVANDLPRPNTRIDFDPAHDGLIPFLLRTDYLSVAGEALCERLEPLGLAKFAFEALCWNRPIVAITRAQGQLTPVVSRFLELLAGAAKEHGGMSSLVTKRQRRKLDELPATGPAAHG